MANHELQVFDQIRRFTHKKGECNRQWYGKWAKMVSSVDSTNHGVLGLTADTINMSWGYPAVNDMIHLKTYWTTFLMGPFMDKEQMTRNVYLRWIAEGVLRAITAFERLGWEAEAKLARQWIKAFCGWMVLQAFPGAPFHFPIHAQQDPGPGAFTASNPPVKNPYKYRSCMAGKRSTVWRPLNHKQKPNPETNPMKFRHWDVSTANEVLHEILFGNMWLDSVAREYAKDFINSPTVEKLKVIVEEWIGRFGIVKSPLTVARAMVKMGYIYQDTLVAILHESPASSTASLEIMKSNPRSDTYIIANPGGRDSGGDDDDVQSTKADHDHQYQEMWCSREHGTNLVNRDMFGTDHKITFVVKADQTGIQIIQPETSTTPQNDDEPPVPGPSPNEKHGWLAKLIEKFMRRWNGLD